MIVPKENSPRARSSVPNVSLVPVTVRKSTDGDRLLTLHSRHRRSQGRSQQQVANYWSSPNSVDQHLEKWCSTMYGQDLQHPRRTTRLLTWLAPADN